MAAYRLEDGEKVIKIVRKHWFVFLFQAGLMLLIAAMPVGFILVQPASIRATLADYDKWLWFGYSIWLIIVWILYFISLTNMYLTQWIITNRRIIDIHQRSLFSRNIADCRLVKIQDITADISGLIPTLLGYGSIVLETAGEEPQFYLNDAASPALVKQTITHLQSEALEAYKVMI